jgi:hypothetical protein
LSRYVITSIKGEWIERVYVETDRTPELDQYVRELASKVEGDLIARVTSPESAVTTVEYEMTTVSVDTQPV